MKYLAIWFHDLYEIEIKHTAIIEKDSYDKAFSEARLIHRDKGLYDCRFILQRVDFTKTKEF